MGGVAIRALAGAVLLVAFAAGAEPLPRDEVPEPLVPWIDWALRGHEARQCTALDRRGGQRVCEWPAQLALALDARGGRFELSASADIRTWLTLPGDALHWPSDLRVDGRPIALALRDAVALATLGDEIYVGHADGTLTELARSSARELRIDATPDAAPGAAAVTELVSDGQRLFVGTRGDRITK